MDKVRCRKYFVIQLAKDRAGFGLQSLRSEVWAFVPLLPNPTEDIPTYSDPLVGGCWWRSEKGEGDIAPEPKGT